MEKYLVGSRYFFENEPDFNSKDYDYVTLVDNPVTFKDYRQLTGLGHCLFDWRRMSAEEFVDFTLNYCHPMTIGKFLVPEFAREIGLTLDLLKKLQPKVNQLNKSHRYEKIIFESYLENGEFELTEEQRHRAYVEYTEARRKNK